MNLAIIETGGKHYLVTPKTKVQVEKLAGNVGDTIKLDKVLLTGDENSVNVGKPFVSGAVVEAKITKHGRDKKIIVFSISFISELSFQGLAYEISCTCYNERFC